MSMPLFVAPAGDSVGLTSTCIGLIRMFDVLGVKVKYFKPIEQIHSDGTCVDKSNQLATIVGNLNPPDSITAKRAKDMVADNKKDDLLEKIVGLYSEVAKNADVVIIEGLNNTRLMSFGVRLNAEIAKCLDADVIFVASMQDCDCVELSQKIDINANLYGGIDDSKTIGCIVNHINSNINKNPLSLDDTGSNEYEEITEKLIQKKCSVFKKNNFELLGAIEANPKLAAPRTLDVIDFLKAKVLNLGDAKKLRVLSIAASVSTPANICDDLKPGALVLMSGDRDGLFLTSAMAALNGIPLAGILLTDNFIPNEKILRFCEKAMLDGLPVFAVKSSLYQTAIVLSGMHNEIPVDDVERVENTVNYIADSLNTKWFVERCANRRQRRLSPAAFRYHLVSKAEKFNKTIVLPEGNEPRTIQAACICSEKNIANCILLGNEEKIVRDAESLGIVLPDNVKIIDPQNVKQDYIDSLVELRKHKGMTKEMAKGILDDSVVLGTLMLALGQVDGLVSGAVNTTANTIRPALQIIKTKPDAKLVSSIFFMCLPEQVLVYGDCAVNPNPTAEELADIAIQSADSAYAFGIEPKVAMISYSTGLSGFGADVDKVRLATELAKQKRPDLLIDGPLQYDAAAIKSVGQKKAPDSEVAGQATVFVFPDLNTGNTTYKAVQRSANVVSIGPMLQGLKKPVNDLSRGALVDDIVYTIALTCIQAGQDVNI